MGHRVGIWSITLVWGRAFELSCCPGHRDIWIFVCACDHKSFPGMGNFSYIWRHIFALGIGDFTATVWEICQIPTLCPTPFPPPHPTFRDQILSEYEITWEIFRGPSCMPSNRKSKKQSTKVMTSQKWFFLKLWDMMSYSSRGSYVMPSYQKLALNCNSWWRYKGSKFDSIPYKPIKICSGSFSLEPAQN